MKRSIWIRIIVLVLVFSLLPVNTLAAGWGNAQSSWGNSRGSWIKNWGNNNSVNNSSVNNSWGKNWGSGFSWIWDLISGFGDKKPADDPTEAPTETPTETPTEDPTEDPTETPAVPPVEEGNVEMSLEEGMGTVDNGSLLRATTYTLRAGQNTTVKKYFPVTMFDYDDRINEATAELDPGTGDMQGLYFSNGSPVAKTVVMNIGEMPAGRYYIQNIRASENRTDGACWLQAHAENKIHAVTQANASIWTLEVENGSYYLKTQINGVDHYMVVGTDGNNDGYTTTKTPITISAYSHNAQGVQLSQNGYYLCQWGSDTAVDFGGYNAENDGGNGMRFYAVDADRNVSSNPTTLAKANVHENLTWAQVQNGTYYADKACTTQVTVNNIGSAGSEYSRTTVNVLDMWNSKGAQVTVANSTVYETNYYYYHTGRNTYYPVYIRRSGNNYYVQYLAHNGYLTGVTGYGIFGATESVNVYEQNVNITGYTLTAGGQTLATLNGTDTSVPVGVPLYTPGTIETITRAYADWNHWNKGSGDNTDGDLIWTGLVQDTLVDDQIVFNVPEGGIFNNDPSVKTIYEYVGLPFVLNTETGVYSFNSDVNGVYFADSNGVGSAPQSGTAEEPYNLYFSEGVTQLMDKPVGDGSLNAWFPFNGLHSSEERKWNGPTNQYERFGVYDPGIDYHFGMRADLPFSMTPNGRVKSTDDKSAPITFTFSGDDDVWVFIDGHLVIDLGGIHNRLDVTIDFAANTITYSEKNAQDGDNATGSFNNPDFAMTQQLFTANGVEGIIPMSREAFALDTEHEMQVFYLERGEGTSNCHIEFNLPMTDTVLVTKDATKSWSRIEEEANPDVEDAGVSQLTAAEQAIVNNIDFGFTLYKKAAGKVEFTPVANTNFYLIGRGVEGVVINQTDAKGHFYLKNGQSAKFITDIPMEGVTYYVVEDKVPDGFVAPDFNFAGAATYDYTYTDGNVTGNVPAADASLIPEQIIPMPENGVWAANKSYEVTVKGSIESNDSIEFICSNFLDEELPNPTALAYEDIIVIDYGLPVNIDPLANDVFRGDDIEIIAFGGANMKLGEIVDKDGDKVFEESELDITRDDDNFHSGGVVLNDKTYSVDGNGNVTRDTFTYTLDKQLTEVEVLTYIIKVTGTDDQDATHETLKQYDYAIGKVYIVPATTMYYEDDFSKLVTFKGSGWTGPVTTEGASDYQEPGVVGMGYSTYGSDVAYLSDSFDSNGTSYHGDTTNGAIQFTYTFTGTGTSIFARTSATTGYMQVKLYEGENASGELVNITYRDTYYKDENDLDDDSDGTLYNIPVYTEEYLDYGTYTVVATVAKAGTKTAGNDNGSGKDFYLDGIRIKEPLDDHVLYLDDEFLDQQDENMLAQIEAEKALVEKALGAYATDGEANMESITLRYKLIGDADEGVNDWGFVVFTDVEGAVNNVEDYITIGPKEEVYLLPGQSVTFAVEYWHQDGYLMHLGMKAPFGTGTAQVGNNTFNLENATDCYYNITAMHTGVLTKYEQLVEKGMLVYVDQNGNRIYEDAEGKLYDAAGNDVSDKELELTPVDEPYYVATYTIKAVDKIVSLTNLKVTGNYSFHVSRDVDINVDGSEGSGTDGEGH